MIVAVMGTTQPLQRGSLDKILICHHTVFQEIRTDLAIHHHGAWQLPLRACVPRQHGFRYIHRRSPGLSAKVTKSKGQRLRLSYLSHQLVALLIYDEAHRRNLLRRPSQPASRFACRLGVWVCDPPCRQASKNGHWRSNIWEHDGTAGIHFLLKSTDAATAWHVDVCRP